MDYAHEIRRQAEAAPRAALPAVTSALWKAFREGHLSEAEAETLAAVIEARQATRPRGANLPAGHSMAISPIPSEAYTGQQLPEDRQGSPRTGRAGSRPRTDASMERRRRWAASGRLPPAIAARFTLAEQSVLAVIAAETTKRGDCRLSLGHIAAIAGVSETTVRNAIREARMHGLVAVEERRLARFRNDTNIVCVVSREWTAWLRLSRKGVLGFENIRGAIRKGGGCKSPKGTITPVSYPVNSESWKRRKGHRVVEGDLAVRASTGMRAGRVRA